MGQMTQPTVSKHW